MIDNLGLFYCTESANDWEKGESGVNRYPCTVYMLITASSALLVARGIVLLGFHSDW